MARVTFPAPDFKADALVGEDFKTLSLSDYKGKYLVSSMLLYICLESALSRFPY